MKNSQKGFVVPLLIAIIALLVVGGGIYIYENNRTTTPAVISTGTQTPPASSEQNVPNNSPVVVKNPLATSGWQTYSSAQYGFSFQYPSTFVPCNNKTACVQYNSDSQATFNVSVNSSETYEDCVRMLQNDSSNGISATIQTTINGIAFEKDSSVDPAAGQRYGTESYRTYYNGACYEIDLHVFWTVQDESYPTTIYPKLEALLPTFRFTTQQTVAPVHSAPVSTSAWVTYNGSLVPITFKYPGVLSVNTKDLGSSVGNLWLTQLDETVGARTIPGSDLPGKIAIIDFTKQYSTLAGVETASPAKQYGFTSLTLGGESAIQVNKQNNTSTDVLYYVAHGAKVYEIIIYSPLPLEVQTLTSSVQFVQ